MTVRKAVAVVQVSDELIVDAGIGSEEDQRAAAARIEARQELDRLRWRALPLHRRLVIRSRRLFRRY